MFPKIAQSICFLEVSEEFPRDSKAKVNQPSMFESLTFYYIWWNDNFKVLKLALVVNGFPPEEFDEWIFVLVEI